MYDCTRPSQRQARPEIAHNASKLIDEEHFAVFRERPAVVVHEMLKRVNCLAERAHRRDDILGLAVGEGFVELFGSVSFISSGMLDDEDYSIVEKDGFITVSCAADEEELEIMGEGIVSCVESYTLDATTREMVSLKTVYTYEDGTVEEGVVTISRDVDAPEGMKPSFSTIE